MKKPKPDKSKQLRLALKACRMVIEFSESTSNCAICAEDEGTHNPHCPYLAARAALKAK